ncbi:MAG: methionyl-tRNA formyltransferase [Burkholderiaceae bacterium]|nr:methionyl-tRNA formyltransferase [Burkholderiaceae bacterium]MBY0455650.1 methionyl-tRNA formyltransferase [Burkholderiaceae bacterium]
MRVMIVGQKWFASQVLRLCLDRGDDVAAVSVPRVDDRLAALATATGIPVCQVPQRLTPDWVPDDIDVILCAHAHIFVTAQARAKTRYGALGYHPSLLPRHRGRDAIHWAIHMREQITGGSVYWLDDGADTGPVAAQDWCWIRPDDTPDALWRGTLAPMGLRLFGQVLSSLDMGDVVRIPQDNAMASWEPAMIARRLSSTSM